MYKINLKDIVRMNMKKTQAVCDVERGDLIEVEIDNSKIIGVVIEVQEKIMCLMVADKGMYWVSKYVNCKKL
jgi:hypothetical protein